MGNVDSIPVISQLKSLFQVMSGDEEGARRTQENFRDTCVIVSQITSLVHAIEGNNEKARKVQEKFALSLNELTDGLPIVGHIKGGIYYALGEEEMGENAMKSASGSLVSMAAGTAGFLVGGPAGAAAASIAASHGFDGLVTGIDTAIHGTRKDGSPRYYGSWNSYDRMAKGEADSGEIFDSLGMLTIDAAAGAFAGAKLKLKQGRLPKKPSTRPHIRCRRDVEFHLTTEEAQFATSHKRLPGHVSEVLTAKWQHLSAPETVSNLVSLFVILRLILWNDRIGREYSRELCIATDFDPIKRCQEALMKTLRDMDDHLAFKKSDSAYVINPDLKIKGISRNSTRTMIRVMASLYGILDSMAKGDEIGIAWLAELCVFEDISALGICEKEVVHKLRELSNQAFTLGEERKRRIKRGGGCNKRPPSSSNGSKLPNKRDKTAAQPNQGQSATNTVKSNGGKFDSNKGINQRSDSASGTHYMVKKYNKESKGSGSHESNHVPAKSAYPVGIVEDLLPAHSLRYDIHQNAMVKVGTSKYSKVAVAFRNHQKQLIKNGNIADAIKLDFAESYGRANSLADFKNGKTTKFEPAVVTYKNELKRLVDEHRKVYKWDPEGIIDQDGKKYKIKKKKDVVDKHRQTKQTITDDEAKMLYKFLDDEEKAWKNSKDWESWMKRADTNSEEILKKNGLLIDPDMYVKQEHRPYG